MEGIRKKGGGGLILVKRGNKKGVIKNDVFVKEWVMVKNSDVKREVFLPWIYEKANGIVYRRRFGEYDF